jgi:CDP-2,3-bis-(O-geranylgeranyl)-sn-glycerol synthase
MNVAQILILLLLVTTANITPVIVRLLLGRRWNAPLDAGLGLPDRRPLLGPGKTVRGVIASLLATAAMAFVLGSSPAAGAGFAGLAMAGDICSSFVKRRLGFASGHPAPLLDQLPESLLPLWLMQPVIGGTHTEILVAAAGFTVIDLVLSRLYRFDRTRSG